MSPGLILVPTNPKEGDDGWNDFLHPTKHGCRAVAGEESGAEGGDLGSASAPTPKRGDSVHLFGPIYWSVINVYGGCPQTLGSPRSPSSCLRAGGQRGSVPPPVPLHGSELPACRLGICLRLGPLPPSTTAEQMRPARLLPRHRWYHLPPVP